MKINFISLLLLVNKVNTGLTQWAVAGNGSQCSASGLAWTL